MREIKLMTLQVMVTVGAGLGALTLLGILERLTV